MSNLPQCTQCPLATFHRGLPATRTDPPEGACYECAITGEMIDEGEAPFDGECDYLTGWAAVPPHPLDAALARESLLGDALAARWLRQNVPHRILKSATVMLTQ